MDVFISTSINLAAYYIREPAAVGKIFAGREYTATGSRFGEYLSAGRKFGRHFRRFDPQAVDSQEPAAGSMSANMLLTAAGSPNVRLTAGYLRRLFGGFSRAAADLHDQQQCRREGR